MKLATSGEITRLLAEARQGDRAALDRLMPLVYGELRAVARRQLRRHASGQTLDTTALVHEAYLKLADHPDVAWQDRNHFYSVAAVAMRHLIVDAARRRASRKRGGEDLRVTFSGLESSFESGTAEARAVEILAVDQALNALGSVDERLVRLVELRFFSGLTEEETAEVLGTSARTLRRDWRKARAFLLHTLSAQPLHALVR